MTPTFAITRFGTVWPTTKFRFDAPGLDDPDGNTVMKPEPDGSTTVTFNTTAPTPDDGTPPRPVTTNDRVPPEPIGPEPNRVSNRRAGDNAV